MDHAPKKRARVEWLWADDSGKRGKSQDLWKPFNDNVGQKIEAAWAAKKTEVKVDKERFVDLTDHEDIWQVRYDDKDKMRKVRRRDWSHPKSLPVIELREECVACGLDSTGKKAELVARLAASQPVGDAAGLPLASDASSGSTPASAASLTSPAPPATPAASSASPVSAWYWCDDSGKKGKSQDKLVKYDAGKTSKLEKAYGGNKKNKKVDIDGVRFVNMSDPTEMWQTRYDDDSKNRRVFRQAPGQAMPVNYDSFTVAQLRKACQDQKLSATGARAALVSRLDQKQHTVPGPTAPLASAAAPLRTASSSTTTSSSTGAPPVAAVKHQGKKGVSGKVTVVEIDSDETDDDEAEEDEEDEEDEDEDDEDEDEEDDLPATPKKKAISSVMHDVVTDDDDADGGKSTASASWFWAGDSKKGSQDIWIQYDAIFSAKLEKALKAGDAKVRVDNQRFVHLKTMQQCRYDNIDKWRGVKRLVSSPSRPMKKRSTAAPASSSSSSSSAPAATPAAVPAAVSSALAMFGAPSYWTDYGTIDYYEVNVKPGSPEFKMVSEKMMANTIAAYHKMTTMNHKVQYKTLQVNRVVRLQNPSLWLRYSNRRKEFSKLNPTFLQNVLMPPPVDGIPNEFYLLHGLNHKFVDEIAQFGFDPRHCSLTGMFGAGLYFAENSSKANQYCHGGTCQQSGAVALNNQASCKCIQATEVCLIACRTLLGAPLLEKKFRGNSPGQFWHGRRTEPTMPDGKTKYNSVVGESIPNFGAASLQLREYIVYESSQVYPEYKIYYTRKR